MQHVDADQELAQRVKMLEQRVALRHVEVGAAAPVQVATACAQVATAPGQVVSAPALGQVPATAPTDAMSPITSCISDGNGMMLGEVHTLCHAVCNVLSGGEGIYTVTLASAYAAWDLLCETSYLSLH